MARRMRRLGPSAPFPVPEAGFDLAAAVDVALVFHRQGQIPQVVQPDPGVV